MRLRIFGLLLVCTALLSARAIAQHGTSYKAIADTKFGPNPALPACTAVAVQDGDPGTSSSVIAIRAASGCVIPWHWHTAGERIILVSGSARMEMKDASTATMQPGDFVTMPAQHVHQLTALAPIVLYVIPEGAFDIHYVDAAGKEIPLAEAVKH